MKAPFTFIELENFHFKQETPDFPEEIKTSNEGLLFTIKKMLAFDYKKRYPL